MRSLRCRNDGVNRRSNCRNFGGADTGGYPHGKMMEKNFHPGGEAPPLWITSDRTCGATGFPRAVERGDGTADRKQASLGSSTHARRIDTARLTHEQ